MKISTIFDNARKALFRLTGKKTLCTITFIYDSKGTFGAGKNKKETVFAWIKEGSTTNDCVSVFPNIEGAQCIIKEVIVLPVKIVSPR